MSRNDCAHQRVHRQWWPPHTVHAAALLNDSVTGQGQANGCKSEISNRTGIQGPCPSQLRGLLSHVPGHTAAQGCSGQGTSHEEFCLAGEPPPAVVDTGQDKGPNSFVFVPGSVNAAWRGTGGAPCEEKGRNVLVNQGDPPAYAEDDELDLDVGFEVELPDLVDLLPSNTQPDAVAGNGGDPVSFDDVNGHVNGVGFGNVFNKGISCSDSASVLVEQHTASTLNCNRSVPVPPPPLPTRVSQQRSPQKVATRQQHQYQYHHHQQQQQQQQAHSFAAGTDQSQATGVQTSSDFHYAAVILTVESQEILKVMIPQRHAVASAHHMTLVSGKRRGAPRAPCPPVLAGSSFKRANLPPPSEKVLPAFAVPGSHFMNGGKLITCAVWRFLASEQQYCLH